jgi:hypothetical protein
MDTLPVPPPPAKRGRGRPRFYDERLFLKALLIMILKQLHSPYELLTVLAEETPEMVALRPLLLQADRFPTRRTWERRLASLPDSLPAQICCLGAHLVELVQPWATHGAAVAVDSTVLRAKGGVWHQKHRDAGEVPHTSIDTDAHWTKSGWHGWVYGWKLHLVTTVAGVWIPLAAELTPANIDDGWQAARALWWGRWKLPTQTRYILGDTGYNQMGLRAICRVKGWHLLTPHRGRRRKIDVGREVRQVFHALRTHSIENLNQHIKGIFGGHAQVPTRGLGATRRWVLGMILVYQVALVYRHAHGLDLNRGLKAFLKAA